MRRLESAIITATMVIVTLLAVGCDVVDGPETKMQCPAAQNGLVTATLTSVEPADGVAPRTPNVFTGDVLVTGSAEHSEGLALHEISVGGIPASNDGFNFDSFSVVIPWTTLTSLPRVDDDDQVLVALDVIALDTCNIVTEVDTFEVAIDPDPFIEVTELNMAAELPAAADFVPASGAVPAILTLTANPEAAGAVVTVSTSAGELAGVMDTVANGIPVGQVTLSGDGESAATASFFLFGAEGVSETAQITASAQEQVAFATAPIKGPPQILPAFLELDAGQASSVSVVAEGRTVTCQANPVPGVTVTANGQNLMAGAVELSSEPRTIRIDVDEMLAEEAAFAITCSDAFGQSGRGEYVGRAAELP